MPESPLKKVACPSCGAPLLFGPGEITIRCQFCNAAVERPARFDLPAVLRSRPTVAPRTPRGPPLSPDVSSPIFLRLMLMLGLLLAFGLIALVVFLIAGQASRSGFALIVNGPVAVLSTDQPEGPEFISLSYDITGETYLFTRLNPAKGKVVWRGKSFKEMSDVAAVAAGEGKFFTVEGSELHAYNAADGTELWDAKLSDQLGYCDECLSVAGDRAILLTRDYVIQAFDAKTGNSAWQRRMDGYTKGFTIADDGLWVIDKVDDQFSLLFLRLKDGTVERQITPECREGSYSSSGLTSSSTFLLDPDPSVRSSNRSIFLLYGYHPGCVDRWDASSAARLWQLEDDEGLTPSSDFAALLTPDSLYFADDEMLWSVAKADGGIRVISEGGDYELVPLAFEQGTLILRTKRTRGTQQFGLRGVDPAQGKILWEYAIENSGPMDPPDAAFGHVDDDESIWSWRMIGGQLRVFIFQADPNQATFVTLDPRDGSSSGKETLALPVDGDSYFGPKVLAWRDTVFWAVVDAKIMAIDVSAVKVNYNFP